MLTVDINALRTGVETLLKRKNPPRKVCIRKNHAEFLGVPHWGNVTEETAFHLDGEPYILVWVKLGDLTVALQGAKGVDDEFNRKATEHGVDLSGQEDSG